MKLAVLLLHVQTFGPLMQTVMPFHLKNLLIQSVMRPSVTTVRPVSARIIGATLFKGALVRERRRANRSAQPFALLLLRFPTARMMN